MPFFRTISSLCTECGMDDPNVLIPGDLDGDGTVTSADAVLLARYLVELTDLTDAQLLGKVRTIAQVLNTDLI